MEINISRELVEDVTQLPSHINTLFYYCGWGNFNSQQSPNDQQSSDDPTPPKKFGRCICIHFCEDVSEIIHKMRSPTIPGVDDNFSRLLKLCRNKLCLLPLMSILNKSFSKGVSPHKLKTSEVYSLHNQGKEDVVKLSHPYLYIHHSRRL